MARGTPDAKKCHVIATDSVAFGTPRKLWLSPYPTKNNIGNGQTEYSLIRSKAR